MKEFNRDNRLKTVAVFIIALFVVYALVLFNLQVVNGTQYREKSNTIKSQTNTISAQRGQIYDRNNNLPLVVNSDSFAVYVTPAEIPKGKYDTVALKLASFLDISKNDIDSIIEPSSRNLYKSFEIKANVSFDKITRIAENKTDFPGVSWQSKPIRNYIVTGSISHVVGYVSKITKDEYVQLRNQGYNSNSIVGKTGIEKQYDMELQGRDGYESRTVDVRGHILSDKPIIVPPQMGNRLVLTIDTRIQELAEKALGPRVGSAIVLKPATGEVIAMVSYPFYDQNIFNSDNAASEYEKLITNPQRPMLNRAINATYPPASTFKTVMSTAMLNEKAYPGEKKIECTGLINYGGRDFNCHIHRPGHGWMDLKHGLAESCDVYYWIVGRDYLGVDKIADYSKKFGFGTPTQIDLPSQASGTVPDPTWKERRFHQKWLGGDTLNMSIGQGYTLVTPLHIANMMAMVCNNGTIYKPHILKEIRDPATNELIKEVKPEVLHKADVDPSVWKEVQRDLRFVITDGTPKVVLANKTVKIAGKTGTGEVSGNKQSKSWHSWMACYGPYDAPVEEQVVVVVLVEAVNEWQWWAPYATNIIFQGIFANQNYDEALNSLPVVRAWAREIQNKNHTRSYRQE